jgi:hypothetical protein
MSLETFIQPKNNQELIQGRLHHHLEEFLGDHKDSLSPETISALPIISKTISENIAVDWESSKENSVSYDKYKKSFILNQEKMSMGQLISSRHWGQKIAFPKSLESSLLGKKLLQHAVVHHTLDRVTTLLNHEMATNLAETYKTKDLFKSQAFEKIVERTREGMNASEQLGVFAESMIQGTLERIALDYEHLGLTILPGNASQDVLEKIDFVISTKQKKRGVGVEAVDPLYNEKHIGVQFTTNTSKSEFKKDQIEKSKLRGTLMDDIIYVALDHKTLVTAVEKWKQAGQPISGPWAYLDPDTRKGVLKGLLESVITEDQLASLLK